MGYNTESAEWPADIHVPDVVKHIVDKLFRTLDDDNDNAGDVLADEVFTVDGIAWFGGKSSRGSGEIRLSRANAWAAIKSRRHEIRKVYAAGSDASDLLFIANVAMGLRNGKSVEGEFVGRVVVSQAHSTQPRLALYQVWGDTSALVEALRG